MFWKKREDEEGNLEDESYRSDGTYPRKICPLCSRSYDDDSLFCRHDGQRLSIVEMNHESERRGEKEVKCPSCENVVIPLESGFCPICKYPIVRKAKKKSKSILLITEQVYPIRISNFPYEFGRPDISRLPASERVNARHLEFILADGKIKIRDLRSLNGSKLNDTVIGNHGKSYGEFDVRNGDSLELVLDDYDRGEIRMKIKLNE